MRDSHMPPDELFAARLNYLFETKRRPDGKPWENSQVGAQCALSRQQIHNLRHPTGSGRGPKYDTITALARFFKVDPNFFFQQAEDPAPAASTEDELTSRLAGLGVTHVAANQVGEDLAQMRKTVLEVLATIERLEAANGQGGTSPPA
ncbi:hypothetical protein OOJ91_33765 [Micromonospora lupini]|uniref:hypothetical protein n=1 Tax=Micromonospora lupini TaxID=285679 RepID=UPI0022545C9A|nr:hypothetical protein [Micromonospora lupini]MCX5070815.1 hypothetical protein [Micromonospora lupini]